MGLELLDSKNPEYFPDPRLSDDHGLIALSTALGTERLLAAYRQGIFPWVKMEQPPHLWCWYSPNPRMLLYPKEFKTSRSLARVLKDQKFEIKMDHNFSEVMRVCASIGRPQQEKGLDRTGDGKGLRITPPEGIAHSIEAYEHGRLVGGLYGLSIGRAFFGESMFHKETEASKACMAKLVGIAIHHGLHFIDCQVPNPFLHSLGAREVPRDTFLSELAKACSEKPSADYWGTEE